MRRRPEHPSHAWLLRPRFWLSGSFVHRTLNNPTLGETPKDLASGSDSRAISDRDDDATVSTTSLRRGRRGFGSSRGERSARSRTSASSGQRLRSTSAARDTVRQWRFRPAKVEGIPVGSLVYVIAGFRAPVTAGR